MLELDLPKKSINHSTLLGSWPVCNRCVRWESGDVQPLAVRVLVLDLASSPHQGIQQRHQLQPAIENGLQVPIRYLGTGLPVYLFSIFKDLHSWCFTTGITNYCPRSGSNPHNLRAIHSKCKNTYVLIAKISGSGSNQLLKRLRLLITIFPSQSYIRKFASMVKF